MSGATVGFEVSVRFYPGAEREAYEFARSLSLPEQAEWVRLERLVTPAGFEREQELVRGRSFPAAGGDGHP